MTENAKKFLELLSSDETLAARATGKKKEELIEIAKEHGITLSAEDFEAPAQALSDDELDAVVGGSGCACVIGGGGSKNSEFKACACVLYGQGNTKKGKMRCMCTGAGAGGGGVDLSD